MSKIQKALGRLRDGEQPPSDGEDKGSPKRVNGGLDRYRRRGSGPGHRRYAVPDEARENEFAPKFSMRADLERLEEFGLQYSQSDSELLAQQFRRIKRPVLNIGFGELGAEMQNSNVVMVASALPKSGKTFCSYNLAISIARERDIGAVLVDADVLKPNISRAFGIENRVGLIDYLLDPEVSLEDILVGTDLHDIVLVPAGQQHDEATELLSSRRMELFIHELSARFQARAILVDTPPLLLTNEAHVLAEHMGQIVFVIEAGMTSQAAVTSAVESLNRDKPINAVVNKARGVAGGGYAGAYPGAYYGYYPVAGDQHEE